MGCTKLADMLPLKYEDNTMQIKEKSKKIQVVYFEVSCLIYNYLSAFFHA